MDFKGIIVTGTSGSGKTTVARTLNSRASKLVHVKAVTTRPMREDDIEGEYDHITKEDFDYLLANNELMIHTTYYGNSYGILSGEFESVVNAGCTPVLTISPSSADTFDGIRIERDSYIPIRTPLFVHVFLDASDEELSLRLSRRVINATKEQIIQQRNIDRGYKGQFLYKIENRNLDSTVDLLLYLWRRQEFSGVLPGRVIQMMIDCDMLLERAIIKNVSGASYDLSLGDEYYYNGRIRQLSESSPILMIEPYDYAIITSHEEASLPRDVCARFDLAVSLFCQGIILSSGPQIDPGFRGPAFCLLFNTSSKPVWLKRRQHYATIEFHKLIEPTFTYQGPYKVQRLLDYLPANTSQGAINELKKELERVRIESQRLQQFTLAFLSLILAIIAILFALR